MSVYAKVEREAPAWWRQHCLRTCEGFRVTRGEQFVGFVESVRWEGDHAVELIVEAVCPQPRHIVVPVASIVQIEPSVDLIELRGEALGTIESHGDEER